jgi:hypothetical protein
MSVEERGVPATDDEEAVSDADGDCVTTALEMRYMLNASSALANIQGLAPPAPCVCLYLCAYLFVYVRRKSPYWPFTEP